MKTVSPDLFGISPWAWLLVPVLCFLLVHYAEQTGSWRDAVMRIASSTLIAAVCLVLLLLAVVTTT